MCLNAPRPKYITTRKGETEMPIEGFILHHLLVFERECDEQLLSCDITQRVSKNNMLSCDLTH